MLYGVAMEIAPNKTAAEKMLIGTFQKIHQQKLDQQNVPPPYMALVKLLIQTAHEQLYTGQLKYNFQLKQFENTPMLQKLICEQIDLENYCIQNQLTRSEMAKKIREEITSLRDFKKTDNQVNQKKQNV
jgi:hypothetical protein